MVCCYKKNQIPTLVKFASQKEVRINGLIAYSVHPISTGKLEGFNNKIKVAKRIAYGYRNESYFLPSFVLFLFLPLDPYSQTFREESVFKPLLTD